MFKQVVFSLVVASFVVQAQAQVRSKETGGKARAEATKEEANKAKEAGQVRSSKELVRAGASKRLDKLFDKKLLDVKDREALLDLAVNDRSVAKALSELAKSKAKGDNALIDDAQVLALLSLSQIKDLSTKIKESTEAVDKLDENERAAYNLVVNVPSDARAKFDEEGKAIAAESIKIFAEEARANDLGKAWDKMSTKMANHPDKKLRAVINKEAVRKSCT